MAEPFAGMDTIYGVDGEHATPYMSRAWVGRLRFHWFYRGDADPDWHDHPWSFWTFPLIGYWEEVFDPETGDVRAQAVMPWRLHHRPATFAHRVLCSLSGGDHIVTFAWSGSDRRRWGFWCKRFGAICWVHWRRYVFAGGKRAPCEPGAA